MSLLNIDTQLEQEEIAQRERHSKLLAIEEFCNKNDIPLIQSEKDVILHPEWFDEFGNYRRLV